MLKNIQKEKYNHIVVTSEQMASIEISMFNQGMPIASLMEKAATKLAWRIRELYRDIQKVGILVGPGHNGGDALVIARELYLEGYEVAIFACCQSSSTKELTKQHIQYAKYLGIEFTESLENLLQRDLIIDGIFGYGLQRQITGELADLITQINLANLEIVSIDIPSGIEANTGATLGTAIIANRTFALGLWKCAHFQDQALANLGQVELIEIGIPSPAILPIGPSRQIITQTIAKKNLPLKHSVTAYKYQQGHLLLICGSRRYAGSAILAALGARASGVGMLTIGVPYSIKPLVVAQIPEAIVIECPETNNGAISSLEKTFNLSQYNAIAYGPGLTLDALETIEDVLSSSCSLILDADGLNILAKLGYLASISRRSAPTILTPHLGEFKRLFPNITQPNSDRFASVAKASQESGAIVLFKGARTVIGDPAGQIYALERSSSSLARGGSGDILTGILGGLVAQRSQANRENLIATVATGAWWHAEAAILAAQNNTIMGVDPLTLTRYLRYVLM